MIAGSAATFGKQARGFWGGFHRWVLHQNSAPKERNRFKTLNRVQNSSFARCGALWRLQRSFSVRNLPLEGIVDALRGERRVEGLWQMTPELSPAPEPARVMVVEDEVLVRFPIAEALRASGLEVIEASNADEAWSYLLSGQTVDLIFSDIQMPGSMDGLELTRRVQQRFGHIIIVLTSGRQSQRSTDHPHFLAKPYRIGDVTALITNLLENKE